MVRFREQYLEVDSQKNLPGAAIGGLIGAIHGWGQNPVFNERSEEQDKQPQAPTEQPAETQKKTIDDERARKIFGKRGGHIPDTPENRQKIEDVVNDEKNFLGDDERGKRWYGKIEPDGRQIWVEVLNGRISNGGVNERPRSFNGKTGLSSPERPGWMTK